LDSSSSNSNSNSRQQQQCLQEHLQLTEDVMLLANKSPGSHSAHGMCGADQLLILSHGRYATCAAALPQSLPLNAAQK
jgi:hypothetical protein